MADERETIQCTACKKRFFEDGFKVNRFGRRLKTCLECNARDKARSEANKCPHGRRRRQCRECGGSGLCEHNRRRDNCRECGGSQICEHDRRRDTCRECGGTSVCEHDRLRNQCRDCGGASICEHGRQRNKCRECGGASVCEHNRYRNRCWTCDPVSALRARANVRIYHAIGTEARAGRSTEQLLGCDKATFFHHIEAQFVDGMSWERIDEIEIDHRVPIEYPGAGGGPPTLEEKVARLDYRNCQPLWAPDNLAKGNRWADPLPEAPQPEPEKTPATLTDDELTALLAEFGL